MLVGQRVVVTRASHQAERLVAAFQAAGAKVARLPLIELAPPTDPWAVELAARAASDYDWCVFTSANAVETFLPLIVAPRDSLPPCAVVGPATARALRRLGVEPQLEAEEPRAEGLLDSLIPTLPPGARVLVPQAADARPELVAGLESAGARATAVVAYRKQLPAEATDTARQLFSRRIGWVTFTSPRIARHFAQLFASDWPRRRGELRAISIGRVTSAELRRLGVEPAAEAAHPSNRAMVEATIEVGVIPARS